MIQSASLNSVRNHAVKEFNAIRRRATLRSWLAKMLLKNNGLRSLVGGNVTGLGAKRLARVQRIRVDQIVGTIRYTEEFDQNFRPLKKEIRDRWVQAFLQLEQAGWQPIVVHKVGQSYYVAKGQDQVSVARHVGVKFLEAEIWDHSFCHALEETCPCTPQMPRQQKESFSTN